MATKTNDLRSQLRATPIKALKRRVEEDDKIIGAFSSNDYLNLEDGKTMKIRIFPPHPGHEDFYVPKKSYWLTVTGNDGEPRRTTVLDSRVHGGTKWDLVEEYVNWAKKKWSKDTERLEALVGTGMNSNSLNPFYSWLCYADKVVEGEPLRAKLWEFKKMVRDSLNKLAFNEDEDEAIEVDPFTDVDEGLPILVKYLKNPNKKRGENYYDVSFPKKNVPRPLTDDEIEYFMTLKPLSEVLTKYGMRDFEKALEGLQIFDEENEIGLFDDDNWIEHVEEIRAQYENVEEEEEPKKKTVKKVVKTVSNVEEEEDEEEESETEIDEDEDEFSDMNRKELKHYIAKNKLSITVKKSMSDDDIRTAIRELQVADEDEEESEEHEEEDTKEEKQTNAKVSLEDIRRKLAGK